MKTAKCYFETTKVAQHARSYFAIVGYALICLLIAGSLQLYTPYPYDTDTAYHAAVGHLISEHGILHSFPWTPFSWLADHYADKELLFHLLFVPLDKLDWTVSSRIVGTVVGATMLFALYMVLRAEGVRLPQFWALIPLVASSIFVFRFALVRPHVLSIALALIVLWSATSGRLVALAIASAIYPWTYVAWELPVLLVLASEMGRLLSGEHVRIKPMLIALAGTAAGIVLHPNSVNLIRLNWIVVVDVLVKGAWSARDGIELGLEFKPLTITQWAKSLLVCSLMTIGALVVAWRRRRIDSVPLSFGISALGFGMLAAASARFVEYFVPFSVAALALASRSVSLRSLAPVILVVSAIYTTFLGLDTLTLLSKRPNDMPLSTASFLQKSIPPGSQVFTPEWEFTGILMLTLPNRHFIVALDPTLFYLKDHKLYQLWFTLPREAPRGIAATIRGHFGARFVLCSNYPGWGNFFARLSSEPGVRTLLVTDIWVLFDLDHSSRGEGLNFAPAHPSLPRESQKG